jgi:acyl carrier protein
MQHRAEPTLNDVLTRSIIADHLGVPAEDAQMPVKLRALGADSLDVVTLTMRLEEEFNLILFDEDAEACQTVGDVFRLLEAAQRKSETVPADAGQQIADFT